MYLNNLNLWLIVREGEGGGTPPADGGSSAGGGGTPAVDPKILETKENELKAARTAAQNAINELNAFKAKAGLQGKDLEDLNARISTLQAEISTKEELAAREKDRIKTEAEEKIKNLEQERTSWRERYENSTVLNEIRAACSGDLEVFNADHIIAILRGSCKLVPELNGDGKPTGEYITKATIKDKDKKGQPITLELSIKDAVQKLSEDPQHFALFKKKGSGGVHGSNNGSPTPASDLAELARTDPKTFIERRKKGEITY